MPCAPCDETGGERVVGLRELAEGPLCCRVGPSLRQSRALQYLVAPGTRKERGFL